MCHRSETCYPAGVTLPNVPIPAVSPERVMYIKFFCRWELEVCVNIQYFTESGVNRVPLAMCQRLPGYYSHMLLNTIDWMPWNM